MYIQYLSAKIQIQISKYVSRIQLIANLKLKKKKLLWNVLPILVIGEILLNLGDY